MRNDFYPFRVGSLECVALCDGGADYSLESMVTNAPRPDVETYVQEHGLRTDIITTPYTYLYVNTGKHKILVDMGVGDLFPTTGKLLQSMDNAGLSPDPIDSIFISHAHPDHVGGVLNDNGELNFTNATYFICQNEWNFWFSEDEINQVAESFITFARQKLTPLRERIILVEKEQEILPSVYVLFAPGIHQGTWWFHSNLRVTNFYTQGIRSYIHFT